MDVSMPVSGAQVSAPEVDTDDEEIYRWSEVWKAQA
jgi:hypothetical protein